MEKSKSNAFSYSILAIIIVLILILLSTYVYQNQKNVKSLPISEENNTISTSTIKTATIAEDMSKWKTYKNTDYGFILKYPDTVRENKGGGEFGLIASMIKLDYEIALNINLATGFAGWTDYQAKDQTRALGKLVTISYLRGENPDEYLFISNFVHDGRNYLISARTNNSNLKEKEQVFKNFVESLEVLPMP